jgi:hypothetical protein
MSDSFTETATKVRTLAVEQEGIRHRLREKALDWEQQRRRLRARLRERADAEATLQARVLVREASLVAVACLAQQDQSSIRKALLQHETDSEHLRSAFEELRAEKEDFRSRLQAAELKVQAAARVAEVDLIGWSLDSLHTSKVEAQDQQRSLQELLAQRTEAEARAEAFEARAAAAEATVGNLQRRAEAAEAALQHMRAKALGVARDARVEAESASPDRRRALQGGG